MLLLYECDFLNGLFARIFKNISCYYYIKNGIRANGNGIYLKTSHVTIILKME